jgi:hypothetical protein
MKLTSTFAAVLLTFALTLTAGAQENTDAPPVMLEPIDGPTETLEPVDEPAPTLEPVDAPNSTEPVDATPRSPLSPWTLRAGGRAIIGLGAQFSEHLEVAYRLPGEQFELFAYGAPSRLAGAVGGRFYFNPEDPTLQYFAVARAGLYGFFSNIQMINVGQPPQVLTGSWSLNPDIAVGVGVDWNFTRHLGLTGSINTGSPTLFFPELAIKYRF